MILVFHVRDMLSRLVLDIYALDGFRLFVSGCRRFLRWFWVVVEIFEVVVDGCRWFKVVPCFSTYGASWQETV